MKTILEDLFGTYTPITYMDGEVEKIASGMAGVDWEYIFGVLIFIVCLWSVFRFLGGLFNGR